MDDRKINNIPKHDQDIEVADTGSSSDYSSIVSTKSNNIDIHNEIVRIENVQGEDNLITYTNNHFTNKFHEDLRKVQSHINIYNARRNSPIIMSNPGSRENSFHGGSNSGSNSGSDNEHERMRLTSSFYNYYEIEKTLDRCYDNIEDNKYSTEIDILTTYVKGQKNLFIHSKNLLQWKLNLLMFPALFLTAAVTIIAPFIECQVWSGGTVSAINATIAFLISLINYLKYESSIESYLQMATQFDKFETSLDLTNSKLLILDNDIDKRKLVFNKIKEFEKKMNELKEINKTLIPEEIKTLFPTISHIQIFSFIKKIENYKKNLLLKYKDVNSEIKYILNKWKRENYNNTNEKLDENCRLTFLYEVKEKIKNDLQNHKNAYTHIDNLFSKEIANAEQKQSYWFQKKTPVFVNDNINNYINIGAVVE